MQPRRLPDAETVIGVPIMADDSDDEEDSEYEDDDDFVGMEVFRFGYKCLIVNYKVHQNFPNQHDH